MTTEEGPPSSDEVAALFLSRAELRAEAHVKERQRNVDDAVSALATAEAALSDAWAQLEAIRLIKTRQPSGSQLATTLAVTEALRAEFTDRGQPPSTR